MAGEKKDDGTGDPFKLLIEEALMQQKNKMMDSFAQILWHLPTCDASSLNGGATPFKLQIKFDIPIFEGQIDIDVVDKWCVGGKVNGVLDLAVQRYPCR